MGEALHDMALFLEFTQLDAGATRLPDESTILRFGQLLEFTNLATHIYANVHAKFIDRCLLLKAGNVVDVTLIAAISSTKIKSGVRDPKTHRQKRTTS